VVSALGLATDGASEDIGQLPALLTGTGYLGMVHGDACPDNVRLLADGARIFDFETSGWVLAGYPAFAGPRSARVQAPGWWQPGA